MKTELLAPAKDKETAFAAIDCGADAVYIGASAFGARHNACNTISDIKEVVAYAHKFNVKVYVTVNTILTDNELEEAVELVKTLSEINADAVLIQDMGLLSKLINLRLPIAIHASTQCDNRDVEKVKFFKNVGLTRVVLARELSLSQIQKIHEEIPDIELESFIHGALCVSYSGQCYLSQYIGGRSANRGECAQPCRKKYTIIDDKGNIIKQNTYALCLKDFNASENISKMIKSGVFSFKIEGRLKDIGYVKNIVSYYRQLLDKYSEKTSSGKSIYPFIPDAERSFNRGFTDYFLNCRTNCFNQISPKSKGKYIGKVKKADGDCMLISTGMDIHPQDGLCYEEKGELKGFLVNRSEKVKDGVLVYPNRKIKINKDTELFRNYDVVFEKELLKPVKRQIGIDVFVDVKEVKLKDEDGNIISVNLTSDEKANNQDKMNETFRRQFSKTGDSDFYINSFEQNSDIPFMTVAQINDLRRNALKELMSLRIKNYKREPQKPLSYSDYYLKETDYRANVHNNIAKLFYEECGTTVNEFSPESKIPDRQIELMRTKHCIKYALNMCKSPVNLYLQDEKGIKYPLKFDCKNCEMVVLSPNH